MDAFMSILIKMSLRGVVIILVVLLVRLLLKKLRISHKYILGLWAMAFLYFIIPWKLSLPVGFWNNVRMPEEVRTITESWPVTDERYGEAGNTANITYPVDHIGITDHADYTDNTMTDAPTVPVAGPKDIVGAAPAIAAEPAGQNAAGIYEIKENSSQQFEALRMIELIWLVGLISLFGHMLYSYFALKRKLRLSILYEGNIRLAEGIDIPLVFGLIRPQIYLPVSLEFENLSYVIAHEKMHVMRKDGLIKMFVYVVCLIHWFNPFIWIAYFLFGSDMEKACDEEVIRTMGKEKRKEYAYALLHAATESGARKKRVFVAPICFDEGNVKSRIRNIMKYKYTLPGIGAAVVVVILALSVMFLTEAKNGNTGENVKTEEADEEISGQNAAKDESVRLSAEEEELAEPIHEDLSLNIQDFYTTNAGDPSNLYYIDEDNVLWGSGRNNYGQLGQGTQDYDFYDEMVRIAEDVIHVDYSQTGFTIYLTEDHKLYGMGNAGGGALQQYETFDWTRFVNGEHYYVSEPYLLMENVVYACCGRDDIACLTEDGGVWVWGTIYFRGVPWSYNEYFVEKPKQVLENAVLVTGGWYNHAALLQDGTVWTWGYNSAGNCGVADLDLVGEPTMVAEDVVMVWTNLKVDYDPLPDAEDIVMAWTGRKKYNREYDHIADFDGIYPKFLNNTVIRKADGSYWVCGENVGTEEQVVHGAEADYSVICTHEFSLIDTDSVVESENQTEEPNAFHPDELADVFGISISLPENPNWIVNSEYHLIDENHLEITYHDPGIDSDCVILVAKNEALALPENEYDERLNESWEGWTINGRHIVVKVKRGKNDSKTVLATWEYNEYQFAIIGEIEGEGDVGPIAKVALSIIHDLD